MIVIRRFLSVILWLAIMVGSAPKVQAAVVSSSHALTLSPSFTNQVAPPGATIQGLVTLFNGGDSAYGFTMYATPYSVDGEAYNPNFTKLPGTADVASWFHFTSNGGYLNQGNTVAVRYSLTIPAKTPPGGYYGAVFAQTKPVLVAQDKNIIQVSQRLGELFYLQVAGPVTQSGKVASWQAGFLQLATPTASLRLENSGGLHYFGDIRVSFQDVLGHQKYAAALQKVVLPRTIRRISVQWPKPPAVGLFKVGGQVIINGKPAVLPSRYILVVSAAARRVISLVVLACGAAALATWSIIYTMKRRRRDTYKKSK